MSEIRIRRAHSKPLADAKKAAEKMAQQLQKDFDLAYAWDGEVLRFERAGVDGKLHVTAKEIRLEARLSLLLAFLKPRIEAEVAASLDKLLRPAKPTSPRKPSVPPKKKHSRS